MSLDPFYLKSESESKKMISDFWNDDIEYLVKVRILLKAFPGYSITKLESRGIAKMWKALSLERQKDIYQDQYKYQI
ncbi:hypothetical protein ES695_09530 [Candidatus Atribacteria bacterium 1244-E10-H5-B2]|nr:MAG: hypothetical protein ES695_09530 [Candidatus Atribacteria bacterium 1244-E10-H5-B2]